MTIAIAAAMAMTACTNSDDSPEVKNPDGKAVLGKTTIGFDAYTGRAVTRGGTTGEIDNTALQTSGFGVFAYYTDLKKYDQTYVPNFMYNTHVTYNTDHWEYTPVMYWPNEYGSDAQSDDEDKVSFFAYAPYLAHSSAASGSVDVATWGITGFSRNTTAGDPLVKYIASFDPAQSVDLCWGVIGADEATADWARIQSGGAQDLTEGMPWLDVEHPAGTDQKLKFTFKHALTKLNVQIDADPDIAAHNETSELAANTKIYVRSISFTGIALKGALNLNNSEANKAQWLDYSGSTDLPYGESITIKDQRRDGREGGTGAAATNELPGGLNPDIVQSTLWDDASPKPGVTHELKNLFDGAAVTTPVYVIPTGENLSVTIVYDVETANDDLSGYLSDGVKHGSSIENRITKNILFNGAAAGLDSGKAYTIKLHLGMNSVKYDATVSGWEDADDEGNGNLPSN